MNLQQELIIISFQSESTSSRMLLKMASESWGGLVEGDFDLSTTSKLVRDNLGKDLGMII